MLPCNNPIGENSMATTPIRVRFAPSPTGDLHLGNIRAALLNYLFARQHDGVFILRIEDTDVQRNLDESGYTIVTDLHDLGIDFDEGPGRPGNYGPYLQSERVGLYKKHLADLVELQKVYRCFCTKEELDAKRKQLLSLGKPPRYDRTCLHLSDDHIKEKLVSKQPFIWRLKLNSDAVYELATMERGTIPFEMKHFSDFALTRPDESFTFLFTNFIDDWLMGITHVIRGEDHLSNTAMQAALFDALAVPLPIFWHLPMLCNNEGKKLSKRDHGFSLHDLRQHGYLAQAIGNYLAVAGGSFAQEVQSVNELVQSFDFSKVHATGPIKYDRDKLTWFNHQWIMKLSIEKLVEKVKPFLHQQVPSSKETNDAILARLLEPVQCEIKLLSDIGDILRFYFEPPPPSRLVIEEEVGKDMSVIVLTLIKESLASSTNLEELLPLIKADAKKQNLKLRDVFGTVRYLLTGSFQGIGIRELFKMLEEDEVRRRLIVGGSL